jgi:hypothetical protein
MFTFLSLKKIGQSDGASRWRVCYQWGLPHLVYHLVAETSLGEQVISSFESKKIVPYGLCNYSARRDVMKTKHFPMTHRGKLYIKKSEQQISFKDFQKNVGTSNTCSP